MTILKKKCSSSINNHKLIPLHLSHIPLILISISSNPLIFPNFITKIKNYINLNTSQNKNKFNSLNPNPLWEPSYKASINLNVLILMLRFLLFAKFNHFPAFYLIFKMIFLQTLINFLKPNNQSFKLKV